MKDELRLQRRTFLSLAGVGAASAFLAACGVGGGDPKAARSALNACFAQPITDLDPLSPTTTVDEGALMVRRLIFDTLVHRDGETFVPALATKWTQPDPNTWLFTLRGDVKFHDGTPLTAKDVAASVNKVAKDTTNLKALWTAVTGAEAVDDTTVKITTSSPLGTMLVNLTLLFIAPADKLGNADFFRKPVGSGPYRVESFTPSLKLSLVKADNYWGTPAANTAITVPYIAETSTAITSVLNGDVDAFWPVPPDQVADVTGKKGVKVERLPSYVYFLNWFNSSRAPFTDPRVRRALWHAVDVAGIVKNLYGEAATVMDAPIPSAVFGSAAQTPYAYDPDKAKALLTEAGLGGGFNSSMMWFATNGPLITELAQALISGWAKVGVKVEPQQIEKATWLDRLNKLDWDMDLQTNTVTTGDADFTLGRLYASTANRMGYKNLALDKVLADARASLDQAERKRLYAQACKTIWDDAVGIFPATITTAYAVSTSMQGFTPVPSNQPDLSVVTVAG
ncbi:ABC transporter substrate-binding protein [Dactylosporangium sp. AC04546]|uniref:ABC transporter substrate-binding protein n=1 Tax=Dactylosporangium sp. AC04546 TaxID=2862460 RepID=UPI001EDFA807|nr:ABC transporter substrate-binding protein [Dactylosporangium sp. AC04546]WVK87088.1 ABC transporter substrate-binding protein [Dactylosporangium sp. AC04546]